MLNDHHHVFVSRSVYEITHTKNTHKEHTRSMARTAYARAMKRRMKKKRAREDEEDEDVPMGRDDKRVRVRGTFAAPSMSFSDSEECSASASEAKTGVSVSELTGSWKFTLSGIGAELARSRESRRKRDLRGTEESHRTCDLREKGTPAFDFRAAQQAQYASARFTPSFMEDDDDDDDDDMCIDLTLSSDEDDDI